jgi:DNA invertase Pin-like site-specific DNA recombinase
MIAAIYARKSTDQHLPDAEKSVTRQIEHARTYAAKKGWTVHDDHVYSDDGIRRGVWEAARVPSADERAEAATLVPGADHVRGVPAGREQIETAYALKQIITAGVAVWYYLEDRARSLDSPTDKILLAVSGFADEVEREKARQRTYDAMRRKAEAGHVTGGSVFGYDNVRVNGHVERRINETEAMTVRRIFDLAAQGIGVRRISYALNAEGAPTPRPHRGGRPRAWSPSSIRAVLTRLLYRGEVVWNRSQKRNAWGVRQPRRRAVAEWVRREAPDLRLIPEPLWQTVARRRTATRRAYVRTTDGRLHGRPPSGVESKYLLTGMTTCSLCGGSLVVQSRASGDDRKFLYRCQHAYYRGADRLHEPTPAVMLDTNRAVLRSLEAALLTPAAVEAIVREVVVSARPVEETMVPRRAAIRADLAVAEAEIARLTSAIARAPDLGSLLDALRAKEQQREAIQTDLTGLEGLGRVRMLDETAVTRAVVAKLGDWSGLMGRRVGPARQLLRNLLVGRIAFTPQADGMVEFVGYASIGPLLAGTVLAGLSKTVVSPTGLGQRGRRSFAA